MIGWSALADQDVDQVLEEYRLRCPSSVDQDINLVLIEGRSRVSTGLWMIICIHNPNIFSSFLVTNMQNPDSS